jgi:CBS domain-containing protein
MKGFIPDRMQVDQIMSAPLITINPDAPIGDAMKLMANTAIRRVYVVENGKVIGRVTQTNAFGHLLDAITSLWAVSYQL